jgi:hypothetical protein
MEAVANRGILTMADMTTDTKGRRLLHQLNLPKLRNNTNLGIKRKRKFVGCSPLDHFEVGEKVGVGTFG